jgi:hypothetical protein
MDDFGRSATGRLMALSIGIALAGSGVASLMTPGSEATGVLGFALFVPIVINILGIPQALEKYWASAVLSIFFLPVAAWLYATHIADVREHPGIAYAVIGLGIGALGWAARGGGDRKAEPPARTASQH